MTERAWYLRCGPRDVADRAVLVGDRSRVVRAAELLDDVRWLNEERGLTTVTGNFDGRPVTVSAFGMGAPVAAVVLHELATLGVRWFVRLGTALALPPARLGDLVLAEGAVRGEGTSATYLPPGFPAVPDAGLNAALRVRLDATARRDVAGIFASYDGFYTEIVGAGPGGREAFEYRLAELRACGVVAVDMETSAILVVARALGVQAASLCLASVDEASREHMDPVERLAAEGELLRVGLAALCSV